MNATEILAALAPALAANSNSSNFISLARLQTSVNAYGIKYELAVALRAAHMLAMAVYRSGGESGAVSSKSEGDLSVSFGSSGAGDAYLSSTHWGQQLMELTKGSILAVSVTGQTDFSLGILGA